MSTRRARIKAVASVPARRKTAAVSASTEHKEEPAAQAETGQDHSTDNTQASSTIVHSTDSTQTSLTTVHNTDNAETNSTTAPSSATAHTSDSTQADSATAHSTDSTQHGSPAERPQRRRIMKPAINIPNSSRKTKVNQNLSKGSPQVKRVPDSPTVSSPKEDSSVLGARSSLSIEGIRPLVSQGEEAPEDKAEPVEQAECSFDPIVPLPSTNKNRPKLRPTPRLARRRNSLQGSASESEDEARRSRRDEVAACAGGVIRLAPCSTPSTAAAGGGGGTPATPAATAATAATPASVVGAALPAQPAETPTHHTENPAHKNQVLRRWRACGGSAEEARRAASRRLMQLNPPHQSLTMYDLIFYNPPNNAIRGSPEESETVTLKREQLQLEQEKQELQESGGLGGTDVPDPITPAVPQVKLGPNGEIIIDEQSLVVETTDAVQSRQRLQQWPVVVEQGSSSTWRGSYRSSRRSRDWSDTETLRFYRALNTLGTDFSLMLSLFPNRTRRELKIKFKKEERQNLGLVDKALKNPVSFDISELEQDLVREKEREEREAREKEENKRRWQQGHSNSKRVNYRKSSVSSRSLGIEDGEEEEDDPEDEPERKLQRTRQVTARSASSPDALSVGTPAPPNVEVGSLVIVAEADAAGNKVLRHFLVKLVDGKKRCCPVNLSESALQLLAQQDISSFQVDAH